MANLARRKFFSRGTPTEQQLLPWVSSSEVFYDQCSRCDVCKNACETNIITKGDGGFPTIDFTKGECTFCYACAQSCPENLFDNKEQTPWTVSAVIDDTCLTAQKITCRSCEDNCEPMAIKFKPTLGGPSIPSINPDLCNGCGACIKPCPTQSIKISAKPERGE
jgi:ferredoxin-type protein NapF